MEHKRLKLLILCTLQVQLKVNCIKIQFLVCSSRQRSIQPACLCDSNSLTSNIFRCPASHKTDCTLSSSAWVTANGQLQSAFSGFCVKWHTHASLCPFCTPQNSASHFLWKWLPSTLAVCSAAINQTLCCHESRFTKLCFLLGETVKAYLFYFWLKETVKCFQPPCGNDFQASSLLQPRVLAYNWYNN